MNFWDGESGDGIPDGTALSAAIDRYRDLHDLIGLLEAGMQTSAARADDAAWMRAQAAWRQVDGQKREAGQAVLDLLISP